MIFIKKINESRNAQDTREKNVKNAGLKSDKIWCNISVKRESALTNIKQVLQDFKCCKILGGST